MNIHEDVYTDCWASFCKGLPEKLVWFAANLYLTLNTLLQGVWAILLSRYARSDDVVFGIIHACRRSGVAGDLTVKSAFQELWSSKTPTEMCMNTDIQLTRLSHLRYLD
jgi:hypothetical protein